MYNFTLEVPVLKLAGGSRGQLDRGLICNFDSAEWCAATVLTAWMGNL
jgi:hypothetical protein